MGNPKIGDCRIVNIIGLNWVRKIGDRIAVGGICTWNLANFASGETGNVGDRNNEFFERCREKGLEVVNSGNVQELRAMNKFPCD